MKNLLLLSLILVGSFFVLGCTQNEEKIETPTGTIATSTNKPSPDVSVPGSQKNKVCHFYPNGDSKVILVDDNALARFLAQGDCISSDPKGTTGCSCAAPSIDSFTATPGTITQQTDASVFSTLAWTTTNATNCSIDHGVGNVACNGNIDVYPTATTTYTLSATGAGGTVTDPETVTVQYCHDIIAFDSQNVYTCPSGATQFCEPVPIVKTSSSHAQDACNACKGSSQTCVDSGSAWGFGNYFWYKDATSPLSGACPEFIPLSGMITANNFCNPDGFFWAE